MANTGHIKQVIGPVVDVSFAGESVVLPEDSQCVERKKRRWFYIDS